MTKAVEERERVVVRFAGDSGDGMQLAGSRFTDATAAVGNDLATLPNFPAEIRASTGVSRIMAARSALLYTQACCGEPSSQSTQGDQMRLRPYADFTAGR